MKEENLEYNPKTISNEMLKLDNNILLVKERINEINLNLKDIESVVEQGVITDETFKNERSRRVEIDKRLAGNISYKSLKDQNKTLTAEKNNEEIRQDYLKRAYRISLNSDEKLSEYLIELNTGINNLDQERIESENRLDKIAKEMQEVKKELSKRIVKKAEEYKKEQEDKQKEILRNTRIDRDCESIKKEMSDIDKENIFKELLQKDETLKKLIKEVEEINNRLKYIVSERQDRERKIKIEAIIRGTRI